MQELKTAEAHVASLQSERDRLWQHLSSASPAASVGTPRSLWPDSTDVPDTKKQPDNATPAQDPELARESDQLHAHPALDAALVSESAALVHQMMHLNQEMQTETVS